MDMVIKNDFSIMHNNLLKLKNHMNAHLADTQIDYLANELIYNQIDHILALLRYNPNYEWIRHDLRHVSMSFQNKYMMDFGYGDVCRERLTPENAYRDRAWIIYEGTNDVQGLTAEVLFKYIKAVDSFATKLINE